MLDVTGNNIANVNTTGFKKDMTIFQDLLYQTNQGASGPGNARGGINAAQVGLGVKVGAIETIFTQGGAQYTGNRSDMMISGEGFFVFRDGNNQIYSRAGNFVLDAAKNLVHSGTGYRVQGYQMIRDPLNPMNFITDGSISDIIIPMGDKLEARATTVVAYRCNLDSRTGAYLPIGYEDIAYDQPLYETRASVKIDDIDYKMRFETDPNNLGAYLRIEFDPEIGGTAVPGFIEFEMIGIKDGKPVFDTTIPAVELYKSSTGTKIDANVEYDNDTGVLKLRHPTTGATLWETNLHQNMNYSSFQVVDRSAAVPVYYNCIAEFDERQFGPPGTPVPLTIYVEDEATPGAINVFQSMVSFNSDGTFDVATALAPIGASVFPGNLTADNFKLVPTGNGYGLEIQAAVDLTDPAPVAFNTVGTIMQGGLHQTKLTVYDCQGVPYTLELQFKKLTANHWRWEAFFVDENGKPIGSLTPNPSTGELYFDESCHLMPPHSANIEVPFSLLGRENSTITLDFGGQTFGGDVMQGVTQFASDSTTKGSFQDGYAMGILFDFSVDRNGMIIGRYTNDQSLPIYRVALAQFANPMGLEKIGDTMFRQSINSGSANIDPAMTNGAGEIVGSTVEMSNVDLTEELRG